LESKKLQRKGRYGTELAYVKVDGWAGKMDSGTNIWIATFPLLPVWVPFQTQVRVFAPPGLGSPRKGRTFLFWWTLTKEYLWSIKYLSFIVGGEGR